MAITNIGYTDSGFYYDNGLEQTVVRTSLDARNIVLHNIMVLILNGSSKHDTKGYRYFLRKKSDLYCLGQIR